MRFFCKLLKITTTGMLKVISTGHHDTNAIIPTVIDKTDAQLLQDWLDQNPKLSQATKAKLLAHEMSLSMIVKAKVTDFVSIGITLGDAFRLVEKPPLESEHRDLGVVPQILQVIPVLNHFSNLFRETPTSLERYVCVSSCLLYYV